MRLLVIGDPVAGLRPASDTSLALAHTATARGHQVWWAEAERVHWWGLEPTAAVTLVHAAAWQQRPELGPPEMESVTRFDAVIVRKDPPFDGGYMYLCGLLQPFESRLVMSNRPSVLLTYHEKMIPYLARSAGVLHDNEILPTCVTSDPGVARHFVECHPAPGWVIKPWLGYGGSGVTQATDAGAVAAAVAAARGPMLVQHVIPEIATHGDRRVFILDGEIVGSLVRTPKPGEIISNLAAGGHGSLRAMTASELDCCARLGRYLKDVGIDFAGIDLIGQYITEVNITSPTGLVALVGMGGENLVPRWLDLIERRVHAPFA